MFIFLQGRATFGRRQVFEVHDGATIGGFSISRTELASELRRHLPGSNLSIWNIPNHPGPVSLDD